MGTQSYKSPAFFCLRKRKKKVFRQLKNNKRHGSYPAAKAQ